MATVGRERELDAIGAFLARESTSASVLVLEGEPGIGKTTLWQAGVATAGTCDLRVLRSSPSQPEQGLAFAGLSDLLGPFVPALAAELPDPQLQALRVALRLDTPGDIQRGDEPFWAKRLA